MNELLCQGRRKRAKRERPRGKTERVGLDQEEMVMRASVQGTDARSL
jgi:hypothetical protein